MSAARISVPTVLEYKPEVPLVNLNVGLIARQFS